MENKDKKFTLKIRGKEVKVNEEIYRAYIRPVRAEQRKSRREWKCRLLSESGNYYVRCKEKCETCSYCLSGKNATGNKLSLDRLSESGIELEARDANVEMKYIEQQETEAKYAKLHLAIPKLTQRQQDIVRMVYFEGKSQVEVAQFFGIDTNTHWIELVESDIEVDVVKSEIDNSVCFMWFDDGLIANLDGEIYLRGTWVINEGEHTLNLSNSKGKERNINFRIEHCYKVVEETAATCSENGVATYECSQCGDKYEETQYSSGHKYNITSTPSSCTESEQIVYTCSLCGERYEKEGNYSTGHNYSSTITREPTCTVDGERFVKCDNCKASYKEVITANGHNYQISDTSTKNGKTTRIYKCVDCGDSYKQELGDQYEEVANYVEYLFEQYSPYMWWVLLASAGIWSIAIGVMTVIAQKNEDKEKAKKILVNYVIGLVVIAVIVVACPFLIRGIAALIT